MLARLDRAALALEKVGDSGRLVGHALHRQIDGSAGRRATGIVMVVPVAMLPDDPAVPVDFEEDPTLPPPPRGKPALYGLVGELISLNVAMLAMAVATAAILPVSLALRRHLAE